MSYIVRTFAAWRPFFSAMWNVFLYGLACGAVFDDRWDRAAVLLLLVVINKRGVT